MIEKKEIEITERPRSRPLPETEGNLDIQREERELERFKEDQGLKSKDKN